MNLVSTIGRLFKERSNAAPKTGLYADRPWYYPAALTRRAINYYLVICVALFLMQNSLLFPRWMTGAVVSRETATANAAGAGLVPWAHSLPGALLPQGYVSSSFSKPATRGTIVVFHGNAGCAYDRSYYVDAFTPRGFRTFLYEYPGYGGRSGSPSASSIISDARSLIRSLDQAGYGLFTFGVSPSDQALPPRFAATPHCRFAGWRF
jgi:hypothetical protein